MGGLLKILSGKLKSSESNPFSIDTEDSVLDKYKPNPRFKPYTNIFKNLLKMESRHTDEPILTMMLTNDSTRVIALSKVDEQDEIKKYKD